MSVDYFKSCLTTSELPTKWLWFYVKIRFPLGFVISVISLINSFSTIDLSDYNAFGQLFILAFAVFDFANIFLICWTYIEMRNLTQRGYKLNIIYLWYYMVYVSLSKGAPYLFTDKFWYNFVIGVFAGSIWLLPNLIYFGRRKDLFTANTYKKKNQYNVAVDNNVAVLKENNTVNDQEGIFSAIEKLNDLNVKGALTEEEFTEKKQELLRKVN